MRRTPPSSAFGLSRQSTGLTETHKKLIRLLAAKTVEEYLAEIEAVSECTTEVHQPDETTTHLENRK